MRYGEISRCKSKPETYLKKTFKKVKKLSKKVLTKQGQGGIIVKLSARAGSERSLKIEQQEIRSTKLIRSVYGDLVKKLENNTQKNSKEQSMLGIKRF